MKHRHHPYISKFFKNGAGFCRKVFKGTPARHME